MSTISNLLGMGLAAYFVAPAVAYAGTYDDITAGSANDECAPCEEKAAAAPTVTAPISPAVISAPKPKPISAKKKTVPAKPSRNYGAEIDDLQKRLQGLDTKYGTQYGQLLTSVAGTQALSDVQFQELLDGLAETDKENGTHYSELLTRMQEGKSQASARGVDQLGELVKRLEDYETIKGRVNTLYNDPAMDMALNAFREGPLKLLGLSKGQMARDCAVSYNAFMERALQHLDLADLEVKLSQLHRDVAEKTSALNRDKTLNDFQRTAQAGALWRNYQSQETVLEKKRKELQGKESQLDLLVEQCNESMGAYDTLRDELPQRIAKNLIRKEGDDRRLFLELGPSVWYDGSFVGSLNAAVLYTGKHLNLRAGAGIDYSGEMVETETIATPETRTAAGQYTQVASEVTNTETGRRHMVHATLRVSTHDEPLDDNFSINLGAYADVSAQQERVRTQIDSTSHLERDGRVTGDVHQTSGEETEYRTVVDAVPGISFEACYRKGFCAELGAGVDVTDGRVVPKAGLTGRF